jgi:hypothetical protein
MAQSRTSPAIFSFDFQFRPFSTAAGTFAQNKSGAAAG